MGVDVAPATSTSTSTSTSSSSSCKLLAGPGAAAAQISLALVVLAALLLRRAREKPKREQRVFLFDVSKQFVSSGAAHLSGLAFSVAAASAAARSSAAFAGGGGGSSGSPERRRGRRREPSECGWYLVLFSVDTVVGSALAILLHRAGVAAASRFLEEEKRRRARCSPPPPPPATTATTTASAPEPEPALAARFAAAVARCGDYGTPPRVGLLLPQLAEWTAAVVLARLCCGFSVLALRGPLSSVAVGVDGAFAPLSGRSSVAELFAVTLAGPLLMNAAQALVQDGVLRAKRAARAAGAGGGMGGGEAAEADGNGGEEGAELLPSPNSSSSVSASPFSQHP